MSPGAGSRSTQSQGTQSAMTIRRNFLLTSGAALALALPAAVMAQDQTDQAPPAQSDAVQTPADQPATDQPVADQSSAGTGAATNYPTCSASVTDSCVQRGSTAHAGKHHTRSAHHMAHKNG